MAKIKLKSGDCEIEIDSRDFYLDNHTIGSVIEDLSRHMTSNMARLVQKSQARQVTEINYAALEPLKDAEVFEPEFAKPRYIEPGEIRSKLRMLESERFFDSPRTVTETVEQLRESGWAASPLDVSMTLAKMASSREISKNSEDDRAYYSVQTPLLVN